jgi:hypothetical protein
VATVRASPASTTWAFCSTKQPAKVELAVGMDVDRGACQDAGLGEVVSVHGSNASRPMLVFLRDNADRRPTRPLVPEDGGRTWCSPPGNSWRSRPTA